MSGRGIESLDEQGAVVKQLPKASLWTSLGATALLAAAAGCSSEDDSAKLTTFTGLYSSYLSSCADCHTAGSDVENNQVPGLVMSSEDAAYDSLMKLVNIQRIPTCSSVSYVKPGEPSESFLLGILDENIKNGFPSATGTDCRPKAHASNLGGAAKAPSTEVLEGMKTWISEGALR